MREEGDREAIPARGRQQINQQQPEQFVSLVNAIAELVLQNNYQVQKTLQAVERLARVVEAKHQDGAGKGQG